MRDRTLSYFISSVLICIFLSSEYTYAANKLWSWTLDKTHYTIHFRERDFLFTSDTSQTVIKNNHCSKKFIKNFANTFHKKIESYNEMTPLPKDYPSIQLQSPDIGKFNVARGTELGLYLIDIKLQIALLKNQVSACK